MQTTDNLALWLSESALNESPLSGSPLLQPEPATRDGYAAIAEELWFSSGADGVAIALEERGVVLCRGSAGECAPSVGAVIDRESGLSAECLRSGKVVRSDDITCDKRVNPGVAGRLTVRSVLAVPICREGHTVGLIEIFSRTPNAFTSADEDTLQGAAAEIAVKAEAAELPTAILARELFPMTPEAWADAAVAATIPLAPEPDVLDPAEELDADNVLDMAEAPDAAGAVNSGDATDSETWLLDHPPASFPPPATDAADLAAQRVGDLFAWADGQATESVQEAIPVEATSATETAPDQQTPADSVQPVHGAGSTDSVPLPLAVHPVRGAAPADAVRPMPTDRDRVPPVTADPVLGAATTNAVRSVPNVRDRAPLQTVQPVRDAAWSRPQATRVPPVVSPPPQRPPVATRQPAPSPVPEWSPSFSARVPVEKQAELPVASGPQPGAAASSAEPAGIASANLRAVVICAVALAVLTGIGLGVWRVTGDDATESATSAVQATAPMPASQLRALRNAAESGDAAAQYELGMHVIKGDAVPRNEPDGVEWLLRSAHQGDSAAQFHLGLAYEEGTGVPQNLVRAYAYYVIAGVNGSSAGEAARQVLTPKLSGKQIAGVRALLGEIYADGVGAPVDKVQAYAWYSLAVIAGSKQAQRDRVLLASKMTREQIAEARQRVSELLNRGSQPGR